MYYVDLLPEVKMKKEFERNLTIKFNCHAFAIFEIEMKQKLQSNMLYHFNDRNLLSVKTCTGMLLTSYRQLNSSI